MREIALIACLLVVASLGSAFDRKLADGETWVYVNIFLTDTHGSPVRVSSAKAEAFGYPNKTRYLDGDQFTHSTGTPGGTLSGKFPVDSRDELESYVITLKNIAGYVDTQVAPQRFYRDGHGPKEHARRGVESNPYALQAVAVRDPRKWRPVFDPYEQLPQGLQKLLARSTRLEFLPLKGSSICVEPPRKSPPCSGVLDKVTFEKPPVKNEEEFALAKMALLNIYALLDATLVPNYLTPKQGEKWIDSLVDIRRIGQERIISEVKPVMFDRVRRLATEFNDPFDCLGYYSASSSLHGRNLANLAPGGDEVTSVKAPSCQGNLQLTVARFVPGASAVYFADIDIDQNRSLPHVFDALIQTATHTGTNPILIYEELGALPAFRRLNYHLELRSR